VKKYLSFNLLTEKRRKKNHLKVTCCTNIANMKNILIESANVISDPILLEQYVAIGDYNKDRSNECNLRAGQTVEVVEKNENGLYHQPTYLCYINCC